MSMKVKTTVGKYEQIKATQPSPSGRQRLFFVCHPADFERYFDALTDEILTKQPNVAVYFYAPGEEPDDETLRFELSDMLVFIVPVTVNALRDDCNLKKYFDYAFEKSVRLLLIQLEPGLESAFNAKYGSYQLL